MNSKVSSVIPAASRLRAFSIHLSGSVVMGLLAVYMVFYVWYPDPLQKAVGVIPIFLLLLCIDVVLGPCLTFTVAKPGKKRHLFLFDLSVIIIVQIAAYCYGIYTVAEGRPAWLVISDGRGDVVRVADIDPKDKAESPPEYQSPSFSGPEWVCAPEPEDAKLREQMKFEFIYAKPKFYYPATDSRCAALITNMPAQPLDELNEFNPEEGVQSELAAHPGADSWLPLWVMAAEGNSRDMVVLLNQKEGRVVGIAELNPRLVVSGEEDEQDEQNEKEDGQDGEQSEPQDGQK